MCVGLTLVTCGIAIQMSAYKATLRELKRILIHNLIDCLIEIHRTVERKGSRIIWYVEAQKKSIAYQKSWSRYSRLVVINHLDLHLELASISESWHQAVFQRNLYVQSTSTRRWWEFQLDFSLLRIMLECFCLNFILPVCEISHPGQLTQRGLETQRDPSGNLQSCQDMHVNSRNVRVSKLYVNTLLPIAYSDDTIAYNADLTSNVATFHFLLTLKIRHCYSHRRDTVVE